MENMENSNENQNNAGDFTYGEIFNSVEAGPYRFIILEKLPFWTLESRGGPVVFDSLNLSILESMLQYPEVLSDVTLKAAISTAINRKKFDTRHWTDLVKNNEPKVSAAENSVTYNRNNVRISLLNKIIERSLATRKGTEIDLGHCVIIHRGDFVAGCKWQLKAGVNIVMTCDDINYIIDYMIDNCSWE